MFVTLFILACNVSDGVDDPYKEGRLVVDNRYWSVEAPIQHVYGMSRGITTSKLP